jgi:oxygen-independent coproporphyrinogen-3 oxidase
VAHAALEMMRNAGFQTLNLDLIYGMAGQTQESFTTSIDEALKHSPEEIYLYPLYVRPLTGLGKSKSAWDDHRINLYRHGREVLLQSGYEQVSMRMFRRTNAPEDVGPVYCCQSDGMLGIGVGARSYTSNVHYCTEYAVGRSSVKGIIQNFVERDSQTLAQVDYGIELTVEERKRRYLILSLLSHEGLTDEGYATQFRSQPMDDFPELIQLIEGRLAQKSNSVMRLTPQGLEWSDAIGPWLFSDEVQRRSTEFDLK